MAERLRLHVTRMADQFADDQGRLWVRDDRMQPGSQQPRFHVFVCRCGQPACPVAFLRHRPGQTADRREAEDREARCEDCVQIVPGGMAEAGETQGA